METLPVQCGRPRSFGPATAIDSTDVIHGLPGKNELHKHRDSEGPSEQPRPFPW